ncbi:hypothetical protein [Phaeocystidibacter luteus]|uniref:Uncharacterized protein n=1 Tax=Phaeocystidibacter luteus TaxID=911197 RepID=A0A6N6RML7_9FLAO|nr:hypothetical protein [Phaeocystidibacter luteus]KAB2814824.1 hypothetical protein F8C67_03485 [Phaeocystidibacter luteus]
MRRLGAILLIHVLLFPQIAQAFLVTNYVIHMEAIEEAYCVNKAKPELECHGSCHLQKEIAITTGSDDDSPVSPKIHRLSEFLLSLDDFNVSPKWGFAPTQETVYPPSTWGIQPTDIPTPPPK